MRALLSVLPLCFVIFLYCRKRGAKAFLIFAGVFFLLFRTDFLLMGGGVGESNWTDGIYITLSGVSFIFLFVYLFFSNQKVRRIVTRDAVPLLVLVATCAFSLVNSSWRAASVYQIAMLSLTIFLYFYVLTKSLTSPEDVDIVLVAFMTSLIFQSILAVLQYVTGRTLDFFSTGQGPWGGGPNLWGRGFGTNIDRPNGFAAVIGPLLFMSLSIFFGTERHRKLAFVSSVVGFAGLIVSFSRGAWMGFAIGVIVLVATLRKDGLFSTARLGKLLLLGGFAVAVFFSSLRTRIATDFMNPAAVSRIPLMIAALRMAREHPFLGVGVNTFRSIIRAYIGGLDVFYLDEVHNQYLLMLSEAGILGLTAWLLTMGRIFRNSVDCLRYGRDRVARFVGVGVRTGLVASSVHMLFDMFNSQATLGHVFIMLSTAAACNALGRLSLPGEAESGLRNAAQIPRN